MKFISDSSFWTPDYLADSAWLEHAPFAFWLMEGFRPRTVVELGVWSGFSYSCFCQAIDRLGLNAKAFGIDTWKGDEHSGFYGEEVFEELNAYNARYSAFSRIVRSTFDDALPHFEDGGIDLLHIDGRHFYEDVKHDFDSWRPKLSNRAIVLFHDTNVRERGFGVFKLWSELKGEHPSFEFSHGHGLGVLAYGPEQPPLLKEFFAACKSDSVAQETRRAFAYIARNLTSEIAKRHKDAIIANRDAAIVIKEGVIASKEAVIANKDAAIAAVEARLAGEQAESRALKQMLRDESALKEALICDFSQQKAAFEKQLREERAKWETRLAEERFNWETQLGEEQVRLHAAIALAENRFDSAFTELRRARKKPLGNIRRYLKWRTSKYIGRYSPFQDSEFVGRMRRREEKNAPTTLASELRAAPALDVNSQERRRQSKIGSSRLILKLGPLLPGKFRARMERRLQKHSATPYYLKTAFNGARPEADEAVQEKMLGSTLEISSKYKIAMGVVTYNNEDVQIARLVRSVEACISRVGAEVDLELLVLDNGEASTLPESSFTIRRLPSQGNIGFARGQNVLLESAFSSGTDLFIAVNPDGLFHPDCLKALIQSSIASGHTALIEALQFPDEHPKTYDINTFDTEWAVGACLLIPKNVYDVIGGFDDEFFLYCDDVDLSWRARAAGFAVKTNPRALFFHDTTRGRPNPMVYREMLKSGYKLALKWGSPSFAKAKASEMISLGIEIPEAPDKQALFDAKNLCDFSSHFYFSAVRW
jgi:GT2 family glycosyltransferase